MTQYAVLHAHMEIANKMQENCNLCEVRVFQDENGHVVFINKTSWINAAKDPTQVSSTHEMKFRDTCSYRVTAEQSW